MAKGILLTVEGGSVIIDFIGEWTGYAEKYGSLLLAAETIKIQWHEASAVLGWKVESQEQESNDGGLDQQSNQAPGGTPPGPRSSHGDQDPGQQTQGCSQQARESGQAGAVRGGAQGVQPEVSCECRVPRPVFFPHTNRRACAICLGILPR